MIVDPKLISWQGNVGILEASDLGNSWLIIPCITIVSPKTGVSKSFYYTENVYDGTEDNELLYTVMTSVDKQFSLRVLND